MFLLFSLLCSKKNRPNMSKVSKNNFTEAILGTGKHIVQKDQNNNSDKSDIVIKKIMEYLSGFVTCY